MILVPPDYLVPWLTHVDFLTKKLKDMSGDAQLHVLNQCWEMSNTWDKTVLNIPHEQVMHREILMTSGTEACWYARMILPQSTYQAETALFDRLKNESLGVLIFQGTQISRVSLQQYTIEPESTEYGWLTTSMHQKAPVLWVRLSEFKVTNHSFYLLEILLPGLARVVC